MADIDSLQRVWDNLISNVEKYADPDQPVTLKIERGPDEAERGGVHAVITQKNAVRKDDFYKESNTRSSVSQKYPADRQPVSGRGRSDRGRGIFPDPDLVVFSTPSSEFFRNTFVISSEPSVIMQL